MIKSVYWSSCKVPIMLVIFNAPLIFSTDFQKILSYWISRKLFQWELNCSMWIDRRTHMDKPYCCILQFLWMHPNGVCERCPVCSMLSTVVSPSIMLELLILPAPIIITSTPFHLRLSQYCRWRLQYSGEWCHVDCYIGARVWEEFSASIFRIVQKTEIFKFCSVYSWFCVKLYKYKVQGNMFQWLPVVWQHSCQVLLPSNSFGG